MEDSKRSVLQLILQPYVLNILHAVETEPKRFKDLKKYVKNDMTLSSKLSRLVDYGLVKIVPLKTERKYTNSYIISKKGKDVVGKLEKIPLGKD
jgi:DNA-binding HxlR family transcriptional regulator